MYKVLQKWHYSHDLIRTSQLGGLTVYTVQLSAWLTANRNDARAAREEGIQASPALVNRLRKIAVKSKSPAALAFGCWTSEFWLLRFTELSGSKDGAKAHS